MLGRLKTAAFSLLLLVLVWLAAEACALLAWSVLNRAVFTPGRVRTQLDAVATPATAPTAAPVASHSTIKWGDFAEVLHPYFGYVADPHQPEPFWRPSDYGFILADRPNPIVKRAPDRLIVGVFGGSFANGTYLALKDHLVRKFAGTGREVIAINFANGGYKQPQQLLILNYLLALGAEFDVVIDLDGFNEVCLPPTELVPQHVNPFFPRSWNRRTADLVSVTTLRQLGQVEVLKSQQTDWARAFRARHLYLSPTLSLLWQYRDRALARRVYELNQSLQAAGRASESYTAHGPAYEDRGEAALFADLVACWERASLQMKSVTTASGARYYHYLQPNQYDAGSKPMNAAERHLAVTPGNPYAHCVATGYPLLRDAGARLQTAGVAFTDLTQIFAGTPDPLYVDDCCHVNMEGYALIAARIYADLARDLPGAPAP